MKTYRIKLWNGYGYDLDTTYVTIEDYQDEYVAFTKAINKGIGNFKSIEECNHEEYEEDESYLYIDSTFELHEKGIIGYLLIENASIDEVGELMLENDNFIYLFDESKDHDIVIDKTTFGVIHEEARNKETFTNIVDKYFINTKITMNTENYECLVESYEEDYDFVYDYDSFDNIIGIAMIIEKEKGETTK